MNKILDNLPKPFQNILKRLAILAQTRKNRIYLVGGVVRDLLLHKANFDFDIVVEGDAIAFVQELSSQLNCQFRRHHAFGTATVSFENHKIDFATARKEIYVHPGALPRVKPSLLCDDLFRRDFTINAMAISLNKNDYGVLIDYYSGLSDLKKGFIRVLHEESFLDDPTRILRAIRFEQRFLFKIEPLTKKLLQRAISENALDTVHLHRLRDELILILQEAQPSRYLKRMNMLNAFSFFDEGICLEKNDFQLMMRIEAALAFYNDTFLQHRKLDEWILYFAALMMRIPKTRLNAVLRNFGLRKGDFLRLNSICIECLKIKKIDKILKPHMIYCFLNHLSFEAIIFFYAYYPWKLLRKNIRYFLDTLVSVRLHVRGDDLKTVGLEPFALYSKVFTKLLYQKLDYGFDTKAEEIAEAKRIFKKEIRYVQRRNK